MNAASGAPVGILDSGIGGLTVAKAIEQHLPQESFVFFGDTAHLPYGDKSPEAIRAYTNKIIELLFNGFGCKIVVVACNTASAIAGNQLQQWNDNGYPVVNVIDPVVQRVANMKHLAKVGVIGTKRTISTRTYSKKLKKLNPALTVVSRSTPLLAPMIEEGFFNNNISQTIINEYLSWPRFKSIDALILGCTHYPHIKNEVENYYHGRTAVLASSTIVAESVGITLRENGLLNQTGIKNEHRFLVSDFTDAFQKTTHIFFGTEVKLRAYPLWDIRH